MSARRGIYLFRPVLVKERRENESGESPEDVFEVDKVRAVFEREPSYQD